MKKKRFNKKPVIAAVLAAIIVSTAAIGFSLAYLTATDSTVNNFTYVNSTPDNSLYGIVQEPFWHNPNNPSDPTAGENIAKNLLPGTVVPKNPSIKNNSTANVSEYAAIKVTFQGIGADGKIFDLSDSPVNNQVAALLAIIDLGCYSNPGDLTSKVTSGLNMADWTKDAAAKSANGVIYFYNKPIDRGVSTSTLFDNFTEKPEADNAKVAAVAIFAPGGINIKIEGAVCQAANLAAGTDSSGNNTADSAVILAGLLNK